MRNPRLSRSATILIVLLAVAASPPRAGAQDLRLTDQVIERVLDNGLTVLMVVRPETPLIRCILAYRVGSVNERPGITGISHFHEHMMFKGSYTIGVKPGMLERDLDIIRQIDEIMEQIIEEESKVRNRDDEKIIEWKAQVSELINRQREETIIGEELWGAYQEAGGTGINASTGQEMTQYYVTLPKNKIELFLALEADRMANPVFREFYAERDVIMEERRMSENRPGFFFREQLQATFYGASPYSWSVLGWMSDIQSTTRQDMIEYRDLYYRPDNATLVMAGDIDVENARLIYKAQVRTENVEGQVYLEMWCCFPGKGEFFSRGLMTPLTGTTDWTTQETPFFLKKGQNPDNVKLNLVINGKGTVWIDDIRLLTGPLK